MKTTKTLLLICLLFLGLMVSQTTKAQTTYTTSPDAENWECGLNQSMMSQLATDTSFVNSFARYQFALDNPPGGNQPQAGAPYIVPVVFHVISTSSATAVLSYNQIKWQLAEINAAFNNSLTAFTGKPAGPRNRNTTIEFRLACNAINCSTPWSNTNEPGVMRYMTTNNNVLNQNVLDPTTITPMLAMTHSCSTGFLPTQYLNVWCVPNINSASGITVGYGTFPWMATTAPIAPINGVVMRIDAIGNNSYPTNFPLNPQFDKGAILAHEFGHYLGLFHTFETVVSGSVGTAGGTTGCFGTTSGTSANNGTVNGDMVLDTPPTFIAQDLGSISTINSCYETNFPYGGSIADQPDQLENYMSYSDDDKLNTFTQGQADRMIASFTTAASPRFNLNTTANLLATGVLPNTCANNTNILTALFNYSIAPGSSCNTINMQFTTPTSIGFSASSWNWTFGDGGTSTAANPLHTYSTAGGTLYTVSCTASDGTNTATYTQSVSINYNVSIVGQSGLNMNVCRGSEQTIYLDFSYGIPEVTLVDNTGAQYVVKNSMVINGTPRVPFTFVANSSVSFSVMPVGCNTTVATFSVMDCCNSIINNGDFSAGTTGITTQLQNPVITGTTTFYGSYSTLIPGAPGTLLAGNFVNMPNITGEAMLIDGFGGPNVHPNLGYAIVDGCPGAATPASITPTPIVWSQTVTLQPATTYYYSFKMSENFNSGFGACILNFATRIFNNALGIIALPTQTLAPIRHFGSFGNPNAHLDYVVFNYVFTTPAVSVMPTPSTFTVDIRQINNFDGGGWDFLLDNITLNQMTPSVQAIGSNTICLGQSTQLNAVNSCGTSAANFNYAWTPTVGLSSNTIINPIANPTTTTVYTLVASPTATGTPASITTVTVTVRPTYTVSPLSQIIYSGQSATLTVNGSTSGPYTWMPGTLTGTTIVVTPTANTVYTVTAPNTGTCTVLNTATVIVSTACSQSATATFDGNLPSGTYTVSGSIINLSSINTLTANTSFTGYTIRMTGNAKIVLMDDVTLTLDNCKLFSCTELWDGIELNSTSRYPSIDIKNGTTIEDMYNGIYRKVNNTNTPTNQGYISIVNSKLNKNYIGVQLANVPAISPSGTSYALTVKNSTLTSTSSTTSPGNTLKSNASYTYAYNQITGGTSGTTPSYTAFPRAHIGINLYNLSTTNNVVIGDSTTTGQFNTFSSMDIGINAVNAHLRVHNNYFYNLKGSGKQGSSMIPSPPTPIGPNNIGVAVVATHTVANTYSLQVGTKNSISPAITLSYPKSNSFKTIGQGVIATNCKTLIAKGNYFEGDTTDVMPILPPYPNTYYYYKSQQAIWSSGLGTSANISYNWIKNFAKGIYSSHTMSVTAGANIMMASNTIQVPSAMGYCKQAIEVAQVGGANIGANLLEVRYNSISKVYSGIKANAVLGGLYIHDNTNMQLEGVKALGYLNSNFQRRGIDVLSCQNAVITKNMNISSTATITASNYQYFSGVMLNASPTNTVTCNSVNNMGRGFVFQGNCTNPNSWMGNGISNSYQGLCLVTAGVMGTQGTAPSGTLAANTWSNVTQETFVSASPNVNTLSNMFVSPNSGSPKTSPTLNFAVTPTQSYSVGFGLGIDEQSTGTAFDCATGGGTLIPLAMSSSSSTSITSSNDALYSDLATSTNTVYSVYPDEFVYQNQQLVYKLQKQGVVTKNATNPTLQSFYNANTTSSIGKFTDVQDAVANNQKAIAQTKNNSIAPINIVQQKTKRTNELMLKLNINPNYNFNTGELQDLVAMANECAVKGWYVVQSRNIIASITKQVGTYDDGCEEETKPSVSRMANSEESPIVIEHKRSFTLFPNPNNGSMTMIYDLGKDSNASMNLYDVTGKLINIYDLQNTNGAIEINEDQLHNGIYFYRILVNGNIVNTNKIVIIK